MKRGTGTGLIVFGVILGVVGAIMAFAITVHTHGFNINTAGLDPARRGGRRPSDRDRDLRDGSRRGSTTVENVHSTPTGQERVEERQDRGTP
jgi:hypothetical protein